MIGYDNVDGFRPPKVIPQQREEDPETRGLREVRERDKCIGRSPVRVQAQVSTGRTIDDVERELRKLDEDCHGGKEPPAARLLRERLKDPEFRAAYERRMAEEVRG